MRHALHVGQHVATHAPAVGAGDIQCRAGSSVAGSSCQLLFACVIPLENTVGGNLLVHLGWQRSHLQVGVGSNETTAVAVASRAQGEGHHVATLQLERPDFVVQLGGGEGVHEAVAVFQSEAVDRRSREVLAIIDRQWLHAVAVGQNDAAPVIELHLAVLAVDSLCTINLDVTGQQGYCCRGLDGSKNEHGMLGFLNIDDTRCGKGSGRRDRIIYSRCDIGCSRDLTDGSDAVGSPSQTRHHPHQCYHHSP